MTKQDRCLADLMKAVREYNEIDNKFYFALLYTGNYLELNKYSKKTGLSIEDSQIDFTKVKYTRGVNMIIAITQEIRKEAERL